MKIAIIIGSVRKGRAGAAVAQWVLEQAQNREAADYELVDVASFDLDLLDVEQVPGTSNGVYENPKTQAWADAIRQYDGFIFVTPEYNHSVPGALKNAVDLLGPEWRGKSFAFVGYGADGGVRAVEHWRQIIANFVSHDVRSSLALGLFTDWTDQGFTPQVRREAELKGLLDQLESLTELTSQLRSAQTKA